MFRSALPTILISLTCAVFSGSAMPALLGGPVVSHDATRSALRTALATWSNTWLELNEGVRDGLVMWGLGAASGRGRPARRRPGRRPGRGTAARASGAAPRRWPGGRWTAPPARAAPPAGG